MQEAIEHIEEKLKILSIVQQTESTMGAIAGYQYSKYLLMELLEKEKEQIINGHWAGWSDAYAYLKSDSNDQARQAEDYYNETYNQNK